MILDYNNKIYEEGNYLNLISDKLIDIVLLDRKQIEFKKINLIEIINKIIKNNKNIFQNIKIIKNIEKIFSSKVMKYY